MLDTAIGSLGENQLSIGGMKAGYQARENQPIAEDYIEERRGL